MAFSFTARGTLRKEPSWDSHLREPWEHLRGLLADTVLPKRKSKCPAHSEAKQFQNVGVWN